MGKRFRYQYPHCPTITESNHHPNQFFRLQNLLSSPISSSIQQSQLFLIGFQKKKNFGDLFHSLNSEVSVLPRSSIPNPRQTQLTLKIQSPFSLVFLYYVHNSNKVYLILKKYLRFIDFSTKKSSQKTFASLNRLVNLF